MEPPNLSQFSEAPIYELNRMVSLVNVRPLTLWAWEQQLGMVATDHTHDPRTSRRRYSERDLMALLWVRDRVVAGESLQEASARLIAAQRGTQGAGYPIGGPTGSLSFGGMHSMPPMSDIQGSLHSGALNTGALYNSPAAQTTSAYDPSQAGAAESWKASTSANLGAATYTGGPAGMPSSYGAWGAPVDLTGGEGWNTGMLAAQADTRPGALSTSHMASTGAPRMGGPSGWLNASHVVSIDPQSAAVWRDESMGQSLNSLRRLRPYVPQLLQSFARFDTARATAVLNEATRLVGVENVCIGLVQPAIARISELWSNSELSNPEERFALNYLRGFMYAIYQNTQEPIGAPFVVVGCAPNETSDFGALLLAVLWRRAGMRVVFLGRGLDGDQLLQQNWPITPALIALTATTSQRLRAMARIGKRVAELPTPQPIFAFCGPVFVRNPELRRKLAGVYLGDDAVTATRYARQLLSMDSFGE